MQIIILAAGKGTRMGELTKDTPKPLLSFRGTNLLEHKFRVLPSNVTEILIVIGYLGHRIRERFGGSYKGIPIRYVEQTEVNGTAGALWICKPHITGSFMVLMSDDIYSKEDLESLSQTPENEWSILAYPDIPGVKAGKIVTNAQGHLTEIFEDFEGTSPYNLIYTGVCVLTPEVFTREMFRLSNGEYGLPQSFTQFASEKNIKVFETKDWIRITSSEDLE